MRAPGAETCRGWDAPVAFAKGGDAAADGEDFETPFVAGDGGGFRSAEEGSVGRFCAVGPLDSVHVGWVDGGGEGADEDGIGGERRGDGVSVESISCVVSFKEDGED